MPAFVAKAGKNCYNEKSEKGNQAGDKSRRR
jgi:hypothetical protein